MSHSHRETPLPDVDPAEEPSSQLSNLSLADDASQPTQPLQSLKQFTQESDSGSSTVQSSQSADDPSYVVRETESISCEMIEMPFKRVVRLINIAAFVLSKIRTI